MVAGTGLCFSFVPYCNLGALQYNWLTLYPSPSRLHLGLDNGQSGSRIRENIKLEISFVWGFKMWLLILVKFMTWQ